MPSYRDAGVDVDAGEESVRRMGPMVARTFSANVLEGLGGFGSLFAFDKDAYRDPVLVSSTDGVGTKTQVARALKRFDTIGFDLVAMCVDDIACSGASPLFFLDYIAVGRQLPEQVVALVGGIAEACGRARCALIGGETAEHPGVMEDDDFDLAGFAVGVVERDEIWGPARVGVGDVLIGLASPNIRSNGLSLVRKIYPGLFDGAVSFPDGDLELLELLGAPSIIYSPMLGAIADRGSVHAAAHITGGGLHHNLARAIPRGLVAEVEEDSIEIPDVFRRIERDGGVSREEMFRTFNMGVGLVAVVAEHAVDETLASLVRSGAVVSVLGSVLPAGDTAKGASRWR